MNAYGAEDPIFELTSNGYIDQAARYNTLAYTYVFDAMAGRLDHAISSASMSPKIVATKLWNINADEQIAFDYNLEFKQPACPLCAPDPANRYDPYRSSDHDPILVVVDFAAPARAKAAAAVAARAGSRRAAVR
jgi:predicted extracellular nuclease